MQKQSNTKALRDKSSDAELRAIQVLNSDVNRSYPEIEYHAKSERLPIMAKALPLWPSRFSLCRATVKIARMVHSPNNTRVPRSINFALRILGQQSKRRPTTAQAQAQAA